MDRFNSNEDPEITQKSIARDIIYSDSSKDQQVALIVKALSDQSSAVVLNDATYKALKTDLTASKLMFGSDAYAQGWNAAMSKALTFLKMYNDGEGLFQL